MPRAALSVTPEAELPIRTRPCASRSRKSSRSRLRKGNIGQVTRADLGAAYAQTAEKNRALDVNGSRQELDTDVINNAHSVDENPRDEAQEPATDPADSGSRASPPRDLLWRGHTHDGLGPKSLKLDDIGPRIASRINEIDCLADFAIVIDADRGDDVCPRGHGALDGDLRLKVRDFELEL